MNRNRTKLLVLMTILAALLLTVAAGPETSTTPVVRFPTADVIYTPGEGAEASLQRFTNRIHLSLDTSNLDPGAAYTIWWVIWNDPSLCVGGCGEDDLGIAGSSALWAAGHVIEDDGTAHFNGVLKENDIPGQVLFGTGLTDAENAEVHIVVQGHGQPIPGQVYEQTHMFMGGWPCDTCQDHQAAIFLP